MLTLWAALGLLVRISWAASVIQPVVLGNVPVGSLTGAAAPRLEQLRSVGFAVLPVAELIGARRALAVEDAMMRAPSANGTHFFKAGAWTLQRAHAPVGELVYEVSVRLANALSGERFGLHEAWTRNYRNQELIANYPHVDRPGYMSLALSYGAPGVISYFTVDGVHYKVESEPGELVVNSAIDREGITGLPATVHQAPEGVYALRRSMFATYRSPDRWNRDPWPLASARENAVRGLIQPAR